MFPTTGVYYLQNDNTSSVGRRVGSSLNTSSHVVLHHKLRRIVRRLMGLRDEPKKDPRPYNIMRRTPRLDSLNPRPVPPHPLHILRLVFISPDIDSTVPVCTSFGTLIRFGRRSALARESPDTQVIMDPKMQSFFKFGYRSTAPYRPSHPATGAGTIAGSVFTIRWYGGGPPSSRWRG